MPMTAQPLTTEHALLGCLRRQPRHGYDIHQQLADPAGLGLVWSLKQSQVYALLAKLEERGYVEATVEPQETRPPRKVYRLTNNGRQAFMDWVQQPVAHGRQLRLDFLAKLYFARRESLEVVAQLIERQRITCRRWLAAQQEQVRIVQNRPYDRLVHKFRCGQIKAMLDWLDTCAATVEHNANNEHG